MSNFLLPDIIRCELCCLRATGRRASEFSETVSYTLVLRRPIDGGFCLLSVVDKKTLLVSVI